MTYQAMSDAEARVWQPRIVHVDAGNRIAGGVAV
jgi:aspartate 1-decarboxylase